MDALALFGLDLAHVQAWLEVGGYFVLFGLLLACGLGLPLPEDIPLLLSGFLVAQPQGTPGKMHVIHAALAAWLGIIGGDCILYSLGRRYGMNVTRLPLIGKHVTPSRVVWAEQKFQRWGVAVVAVARMFAGVRGAMVVAAGIIRFNFARFVITDGLAAIFSGGFFMYVGYWAGKKVGRLDTITERIHHGEHWILGVALILAVLITVWLWWRSKSHPHGQIIVKPENIIVTVDATPGFVVSPVSSSNADGTAPESP